MHSLEAEDGQEPGAYSGTGEIRAGMRCWRWCSDKSWSTFSPAGAELMSRSGMRIGECGDVAKRKADKSDGLAPPGVGHEQIAVGCLDDRGVRELAWSLFESFEDLEVLPIGTDCEIERRACVVAVVEGEDDAAVSEADGIDAGVGVGQGDEVDGAPCFSIVEGVGDCDARGSSAAAGIEAQMMSGEEDDRGLDDADGGG